MANPRRGEGHSRNDHTAALARGARSRGLSGAAVWAAILLGALLAACSRPEPFVTRASGDDSVVIRNVRVFDSPRAALLPGLRDVVVRGGTIVEIAPPGVEVADLAAIDGRGGTLLPGLVDAHVHVGGSAAPRDAPELPNPEQNLGAWLYAGVTTVLDLGGLTPDVLRLRDDVRSGKVLGPRLYAAGPMFTAPGGHPVAMQNVLLPWWARWYVLPRVTREIETTQEAEAAVEALLADDPDVLKIAIDRVPKAGTPRLAGETIASITAAGHAGGVRSVAHVGRSADAIEAVRAGVDALVHGVYLEDMTEEAVAAVAAAGVPVVATISVFDAVEDSLGRRDERLPIEREIGGSATLAALAAQRPDAELEPFVRDVAAAHDARRKNVRRLRDAGVTILAGSDAPISGHFPGAGLHVELAKLVEAGLTPGEALRAATYENARFLAGDDAAFGEIAAGKRADLVLVAGDPVADPSALGRIERVFLGGVSLDRRSRAE